MQRSRSGVAAEKTFPRPGSRTRSATAFPCRARTPDPCLAGGKCRGPAGSAPLLRCRCHRDWNRLLARARPNNFPTHHVGGFSSGRHDGPSRLAFPCPQCRRWPTSWCPCWCARADGSGARADGSIGCGEVSGDGFRMRSEPRSIGPRRRRWRCADRIRDGLPPLSSPVRRAHRGTLEVRRALARHTLQWVASFFRLAPLRVRALERLPGFRWKLRRPRPLGVPRKPRVGTFASTRSGAGLCLILRSGRCIVGTVGAAFHPY